MLEKLLAFDFLPRHGYWLRSLEAFRLYRHSSFLFGWKVNFGFLLTYLFLKSFGWPLLVVLHIHIQHIVR